MTRFLARHIDSIYQPGSRLIFTPDENQKNIGRREATIGLRNSRPSDPSVFLRKTTRIAFASYATCKGGENGQWIGLNLATPSAQWVQAHKSDKVSLQVSHPRTLLDMALQDMGQVVLPCFIGDSEISLKRTSDIISSLTHDQWLVVHGHERT